MSPWNCKLLGVIKPVQSIYRTICVKGFRENYVLFRIKREFVEISGFWAVWKRTPLPPTEKLALENDQRGGGRVTVQKANPRSIWYHSHVPIKSRPPKILKIAILINQAMVSWVSFWELIAMETSSCIESPKRLTSPNLSHQPHNQILTITP